MFELEFPYSEGEATVDGQVGVTEEGELRSELGGFGKRFAIEEADADELAGDFDEHLVIAGLEHVEPEYLHLLVDLFGLQLVGLLALDGLRLIQGIGQEHLFEQLGVIKPVGVLFQEGNAGEERLRSLQFRRVLEIEER